MIMPLWAKFQHHFGGDPGPLLPAPLLAAPLARVNDSAWKLERPNRFYISELMN